MIVRFALTPTAVGRWMSTAAPALAIVMVILSCVVAGAGQQTLPAPEPRVSFRLEENIEEGKHSYSWPMEVVSLLRTGDQLYFADEGQDRGQTEELVLIEVDGDSIRANFQHNHQRGAAVYIMSSQAPQKVIQQVARGSDVQLKLNGVAGLKRGSRVLIDGDLPDQAEVVTVTAVDYERHSISASVTRDHARNAPAAVYEQQPCTTRHRIVSRQDRGIITVGCPKVWRSDRVFTVLDGILRDVDSITLRALQDLDANKANATQLIQIVNDLQVAVKADQAAAINSALDRQKIAAERGSDLGTFASAQESNLSIQKRQQELIQRRIDLQQQRLQMIAQGKTDEKQPPLKTLDDQIAEIDKQLGDLKNLTTTPSIKQETLAAGDSTTATAANATTTPSIATADLFKTILQQGLQNPSFPPAVQMDNVIELLHQRLSREFSVLYDDLSRQSQDYDIYLVQFDIGIVPRPGSKDREARVMLEFPRNFGILAYDLYPGGSSYNTLRGMNKTNRIGLSGAAQTVLGFGLAANFAHERSELRSGLSQSLFVSGFGAGKSDFGWEIGASPFDDFINPGNRVVHAIILVPKGQILPGQAIPITARYSWPTRQPRYNLRGFLLHALEVPFYGFGMPFTNIPPAGMDDGYSYSEPLAMVLPDVPHTTIKRISYSPMLLKETPGTQTTASTAEKPSTVQITFYEPVDPNLIVTVNDKLINRVRDVRGRGLYNATAESVAGNDKEQAALKNSRFGLLEADTLGPDTWLQLNSRSILLNLSKDTAGTDTFPTITLSDPGSGGAELLQMANQQKQATIRAGDWLFENARLPESAFLPLYTLPYQPGRVEVYVEEDQHERPQRLRIISDTHREGRNTPVWLHEQAQVVLVSKDNAKNINENVTDHWALDCDGEEGTLSCKVPIKDIASTQIDPDNDFPKKFKVWVDEPPYLDRPGLWADHDIEADATWKKEVFYKGDWSEIGEECLHLTQNSKITKVCKDKPWNRWHAEIKLKNLDPAKKYEVKEFMSVIPQLQIAVQGLTKARKNAKTPESAYFEDVIRTMNQYLPQTLSKNRNPPEKPAEEEEPVRSELKRESNNKSGVLSLDIAFQALPILPDNLHLVTCTLDKGSCDPVITLPKLYPRLLPGPVKFTDFADGTYRLEGDRLRAVDKVRLEKDGDVILVDPRVGYNDVNFSLPPAEKKIASDAEKQAADAAKKAGENPKPVAKKYSVFVMINGVTFPVYQLNSKQLEQVSFTYPKPKEDITTKPKPDQSGTSDRSNVQSKMKNDVGTDAKANETKGGKATPTRSGTGASGGSGKVMGSASPTPSPTPTPTPTPTPARHVGKGTSDNANKGSGKKNDKKESTTKQ